MRGEYSKYDTYSFMKVATNVMFMQMSENSGENKFGQKAVVVMVKEYRQIYKVAIEGNPVVILIYPGTLSYE